MRDRKNRARYNPLDPNRSSGAEEQLIGRISTKLYKTAVLTACDRYEKEQEFKAQHGPVKIIMRDGKIQP